MSKTQIHSGLFGPLIAAALALFLPAVATADDLPQPFEDASRLVSIGGSLTEIVFALGEEERLVARDTTSTYPPEAEELPDVGYMRALSPEGVLSVSPSAILALEGSGPPETMDVLGKASVPLLLVPEEFDADGILQKIRLVGNALGEAERAQKLAAKVARDIEAAQALTADLAERKRVLFILGIQGGRIMASGTGTAADGIIRMAGGTNAIGDFAGYKQVSEEAIIQARPDVVLMMDRGGDHGGGENDVLSLPAIASTPAGRNESLVRMDGSYLLGFGPRTAGAIRDLAAALYGPSVAN